MRAALYSSHLDDQSKEVMRLGTALLGTLAALVLGLLIASAKNSFDAQSAQVNQITADVVQLDVYLAEYGADTKDAREQLRVALIPLQEAIWRTDKENWKKGGIQVEQRGAKKFPLFAQSGEPVPIPFLVVLVFWLAVIFMSFSLFARLNAMVLALIATLALSFSGAVFLILSLKQPFHWPLQISSAPLRKSLPPLAP